MKEDKVRFGGESQNMDDELLDKAVKLMSVYCQATGSNICIYDSAYRPIQIRITEPESGDGNADSYPENESAIEKLICPCCIKYRPGTDKPETFPCHGMHINAIREANRKGGSHIYQCESGFMFWTSPIFTDGSFSGALRGSGFLNDAAPDNTHVMCNNEITQEEFRKRFLSFSRADSEKIQSLAEMLLLCAETLSTGSDDYHEILRRRMEQQEVIAQLIEELKAGYAKGGVKPGYPLTKERMLIAALRRGDSAEAKQLLNELLAALIFSNPGNFKYVQLRAIELVVLLSRIEISPGKYGSLAMETNSRSLKRVQEAKSIEELTDILHGIVERVSSVISSFQGIPHAVALRKAENFILENYTRKISLQEIADVAGLSAPYFSTIFKEEMGENLSKYLNRLRVEKASRLLLETETTLSDIASACCFEDQSWFSKIFKAYTGISPGKYRNQGGGIIRNISENNLSEDFLNTNK
ncbi:MAG: helix-turn-helix domain-containing protein [Treponema sp.]|nr:helix-turn-helix domain-containing protein [Treponema sp.]